MPSFFKDLRRRSRASLNLEQQQQQQQQRQQPGDSASSNESNDSHHEGSSQSAQSVQSTPHPSHEQSPSAGGMSSFFGRPAADQQPLRNTRSQSSTNLNLSPYGTRTPPISGTPPMNGSTPPWGNERRPGMPGSSNRYSIAVRTQVEVF